MKRKTYLLLACAAILGQARADNITVCDFEKNEIGQAFNMKDIYNTTTTSTAVVEADPANEGNKVLHVKNTSWNTFIEFELPDGVDGGNMADMYQSISFDIYRPASDQNDWMQMAVLLGNDQLYWDEGYPHQGDKETWVKKTYELKYVKNDAVRLYVGYNNNTAEYYIDNIVLSGVSKEAKDTLRWTGATSDVWDVGTTPNFATVPADGSEGEPACFANGYAVIFDDTPAATAGAGTARVVVSETVEAPSILFSNKAVDYTLTAQHPDDAITGFGKMSVEGGGTVTMDVNNNMNGGTYLHSGMIRMGNAGLQNPFGTKVETDGGALHFSLNTSDYVSVNAPIDIAEGSTLDVYTSRYTYWMSQLSGKGTLNIYAGGERSYLGNAKGAQIPDWSQFSGTVNLYPYKEVYGSAGFYGLVLGHGGKTFNPEEVEESIEAGKVNATFENKTLIMHDNTTLACESGTRGFRIGELRMAPTARLCGYYKASNPKSYYLVGCLGTDSELAGQIAPADKNGKPYESQQVGLIKEGAGTYTLTNNNNLINGGIRVLDGRLLVNNNTAEAEAYHLTGGTGYATGTTQTFVFSKATIGGNGSIAGNTDVYGTIEPGSDGTGTLTLKNFAKDEPVALYLRPTTTINMEIASADDYDRIVASGDIIYYNICEDFTESDDKPTVKLDVKDSYQYNEGDEFVLIEAKGKGSLYGDPWNFNIALPDNDKWTVEEREAEGAYRLVLTAKSPSAVKTATDTGKTRIYSANGNIYVNTEAGKRIKVYSASGQLLSETVSANGLNTISGVSGMAIVDVDGVTMKINNK